MTKQIWETAKANNFLGADIFYEYYIDHLHLIKGRRDVMPFSVFGQSLARFLDLFRVNFNNPMFNDVINIPVIFDDNKDVVHASMESITAKLITYFNNKYA